MSNIINKYLAWRQKHFPASKYDVAWRHERVEALLAYEAQKIRDHITDELENKLEKLEAFEELYDTFTSGWRIPPWTVEPFKVECVEEWKVKYEVCFAPIERELGRFYTALVAMLRPHRILETGTNAGYSTYCLARGFAGLGGERQIFSLDPGDACHLFLGTEEAHKISFIRANSLEVDLDIFADRNGTTVFDMLIFDSDHRYRTIVGEINRYAPLLRIGGVMGLHDSMFFDGIGLVVKQLMERDEFEVVNLPTPRDHGRGTRCPGITVARKIAEVAPGFLAENPEYMDIEINLPGRTDMDAALI